MSIKNIKTLEEGRINSGEGEEGRTEEGIEDGGGVDRLEERNRKANVMFTNKRTAVMSIIQTVPLCGGK